MWIICCKALNIHSRWGNWQHLWFCMRAETKRNSVCWSKPVSEVESGYRLCYPRNSETLSLSLSLCEIGWSLYRVWNRKPRVALISELTNSGFSLNLLCEMDPRSSFCSEYERGIAINNMSVIKCFMFKYQDWILAFLIPSDGLDTEFSKPLFLLTVFQSSANVLSCSRGLVPLAWKYSNTADSLTVP